MLLKAGQTAGPNGLKTFCGHSWVARGVKAKKIEKKILNIFFHGQRRALQLV